MRIDCLRLKNFKGFKERELLFHPQFNLVVGENGTGKTSLLDALSIAAGSWFLGIPGVDTRHIRQEEVRLEAFEAEAVTTWESQYPCIVEVDAYVLGKALTWHSARQGPDTSITETRQQEIKSIAAESSRAVREGKPVALPLIAYYGTGRLWDIPRKQAQVSEPPTIGSKKGESRLDGYKTSVNPRLSVRALTLWIARQSWLAFQQGGVETNTYQAVRRALLSCVPGAENLHFDAKLGEVVVRFRNGVHQPFMNLSDGQRSMLALVGDLAQKAATLNPHLGEHVLEETNGLVLIDELDLHLHPTWQRHVIEDLRNTFPKLQFICTTHSPFLIQSLRSGEELLMLEGQPTASLGDLSIADIAEGIQGLSDTSVSTRYAAMKDSAKRYLGLLEEAQRSPEQTLAQYKQQLADTISPFADNPAFQAFLELQRVATLGES